MAAPFAWKSVFLGAMLTDDLEDATASDISVKLLH
jgi:hypothetical protein